MKRVWFGCVLFALISAGASAAEGTFCVRLVEPAEHVEALAGSTLPIVWEAGKVPAGIEEWEAFVSIDGGRTYPVRITPHLDAGIHRFNWIVPSLPGADVSILLRFGDEREEREFPFEGRVRIAGSMACESFRNTGFLQRAKENDHGRMLTEWVDGSRKGTDLHHVVAGVSWLVGDHAWNSDRDRDTTLAIGASLQRFDGTMRVSRACGDGAAESRHEGRLPLRFQLAGVLLLSGRLNI